MKKLFTTITLSLTVALFFAITAFAKNQKNTADDTKVKWVPIQSAVETAKAQNKKFIFVHIYTDWCGWCKKMEDNVFTDQAILADFDADFVPVKFNAETQDIIQFNGTSYGFDNSGKRGANKLALELGNVGGKIGYPTLVVLDASGKKLQTFPGFKDVQTLNELLNYFQSGSYQKMDFQQFQAGQ